MSPGYGKRIDALLARLGTEVTEAEFTELALACLDQAGLSVLGQERVRAEVAHLLYPALPTDVS